MAKRGWIKLECDLCGEPDGYPADKPGGTAEQGWTEDEQPDGRVLDLCPNCTVEFGVRRFTQPRTDDRDGAS